MVGQGETRLIIEALFLLLKGLGDFLYALLPNWSVGPDIWDASTYHGPLHMGPGGPFPADNLFNSSSPSAATALLSYMYRYNPFIPVYEGLLIINYALSIGVASTVYRGILWVAGMVRGAGTSI